MLENILETAGDLKEPPESSIAKQWLPGWIRWPVRVAILPFVLLDLGAQWIARKIIPTPYKKVGVCKKRGNCCYYILIRKTKYLGFFDLFWHTQINGFYKRSNSTFLYQGKKIYVMGCRYLQKDGSCKHYRLRPTICRTWPRIEIFGRPEILKGCGFQAQPRGKLSIFKDTCQH